MSPLGALVASPALVGLPSACPSSPVVEGPDAGGGSLWRPPDLPGPTRLEEPCLRPPPPEASPRPGQTSPLPPLVQVDGGSQSLPRILPGVPALTHTPRPRHEAVALAGVPGQGGSPLPLVPSSSPSCPLRCPSSAQPWVSSSPWAGALRSSGKPGRPRPTLLCPGVCELVGRRRDSWSRMPAQGLLPTLRQGPLGAPQVPLGQPGAGGAWSFVMSSQGLKEPGRLGAPPARGTLTLMCDRGRQAALLSPSPAPQLRLINSVLGPRPLQLCPQDGGSQDRPRAQLSGGPEECERGGKMGINGNPRCRAAAPVPGGGRSSQPPPAGGRTPGQQCPPPAPGSHSSPRSTGPVGGLLLPLQLAIRLGGLTQPHSSPEQPFPWPRWAPSEGLPGVGLLHVCTRGNPRHPTPGRQAGRVHLFLFFFFFFFDLFLFNMGK